MSLVSEQVLVASHGYSDADIFFLGGYPLKDDILNGIALVGSIEGTLNSYLRPHGINLKNCYRSVFIKEKLSYSGTNSKFLKETLANVDLKHYEEILLQELKDINPTVIVPLDDIALGVLHPYINTISKPRGRKFWVYCYRGSVLPLRSDWILYLNSQIKVIPVVGPQLLYSDHTARSYTQLDFQRIARERQDRNIKSEGIVWVCKTYKEFDSFLDRQWKKSPKRVTFDIETFGGMITCISFCFDNIEAVSVPIGDYAIPLHERALFYRRIAKILASDLEKNNQNIKYDWIILERHGFHLNNVTSDSMLKGALIYPELPKGLDFYTSIYTDIPYYKDEGKEFDPRKHEKDRLYLYNAKDSLAAAIVATEEDKELEEDLPAKQLYENEIAPSIIIYKNLDNTGLLVDDAVKQAKLAKYERLFESNQFILRSLVGNNTFNARSPKQVGQLIYDQLGFPLRYKTNEFGVKTFKTDKDTLDDLLIHHGEDQKTGKIGYNILSRIIVCRKLAKAVEYINTPLHPDNTLRGSYNLSGPETGRSSCSKTIDERFRDENDPNSTKATKRLGRSLQTISKHGFAIDEEIFNDFEDSEIASDIREIFVPPHDCVFIEGDGQGAEARVVFVLAEDYENLASMDQKPKIHAKTAAAIFNMDPNLITSKGPAIPKVGITYYDLGKKVRHAGNYLMGAFRMAQMTHLPLKFCLEALTKFHEKEPQLKEVFHKQIEEIIKRTRILRTPFGRSRTFYATYSESLFKEAIAYIPQSTISDLTKFTMWRIADKLPGYMTKYKFINEQHDSLLTTVHKDIKEQYLETFKQQYERPIDFLNCSLSRDFKLVVPTELFVGEHNWMNMVEVKL